MKKIEKKTFWYDTVIEYLIGAAIICVPLWYGAGHLFPFTVAKSLLVTFFALIIGALYLWGKSDNNPLDWSWHPIHIIIKIFGISLIFSALIGLNPEFSFFGSLIDATGLNVMLSALVIAGVGSVMIQQKPERLIAFFWISLITSMIVAIGAFSPVAFPTTSGGSTFGNTSYMSAYFLINICFAVALFVRSTERWKKIFAGFFGGVLIFAPTFFNRMLLTGDIAWSEAFKNPLLFAGVSNGATIALAVMIPVLIGFFMIVLGDQKWKKIVGGTLVGIATVGMIGFWALFQSPGNPINEFFVERKSNNRLIFWDIAKQGIAQRPLFGWGMNNYAYVFQEKFTNEFFLKKNVPELWTNNPHNMVLEIGVNHGLVGLGLYLAIYIGAFGYAVRESLRDKKKAFILIPLASALVGYFIQNLFIFDTPGTTFIFWLIIGFIIGSLTGWKKITLPERYRYVFGGFMKVLAIVLICLIPALVFKPWKESKAWVRYTAFENIASQVMNPQSISRLGYISDTAYITGRFIDIARVNIREPGSQEQALLLQIMNNLRVNLEQELAQGVDNVRGRWTLGRLLLTMMVIERQIYPEVIFQAEEHIDRAIAMSPQNAFIYFDKVQLLFIQERWDDAQVVIEKIIALAPERTIGYQLAEQLNQSSPRPEFFKKIMEMKQQYNPVP